MLSQEEAQMICEAHNIDELLLNEEEVECLDEHNPELLEAYLSLQKIANGVV